MSQASWVSIVGAVASIIAAAVSGYLAWKGATETAEINRAGAEEVARIHNEGALDTKMFELAMLFMQSPNSSVEERKWAIDVLCTWQKMQCSPERRDKIARSGKSLAEIGETVPEAKALNAKLDTSPFWRDLHKVPNMYEVPDLYSPSDGTGAEPGIQIERAPGNSEGNQLELQKN